MSPAGLSATLELGPTASYARRLAEWCGDGPGEGVLTLTVWKRAAAPEPPDVYRVEETPVLGAPGRAFLLVNVFDAEQPDVYETFVGRDCRCTCTAGNVKRAECKHVSALRRLVADRLV